MNATEVVSSPSRNVRTTATDANHFILTFENNRLASELFGQFDQHLKLLEQRLQIEAR
ncbi:MAG: phosphate starvation-inducible protein PhoH, partial [Allorhizobium sp.]